MSERLETLKKARDRMIEDRDAHAKVLAAPFVRETAERARNKFVEMQGLIDALDRAINGEMPGSGQKLKRRKARSADVSLQMSGGMPLATTVPVIAVSPIRRSRWHPRPPAPPRRRSCPLRPFGAPRQGMAARARRY